MSGALNALATAGGRPFSATITPTSLSATGTSDYIVSGPAQVIITGGVGPFSIAWDAEAGGLVALATNSATTSFAAVSIAPEDSRIGYFGATVTDSGSGAVQRTDNTVQVNISRV